MLTADAIHSDFSWNEIDKYPIITSYRLLSPRLEEIKQHLKESGEWEYILSSGQKLSRFFDYKIAAQKWRMDPSTSSGSYQ